MENAIGLAYSHATGDLTFATLSASARALAAQIASVQPGDRSPVMIFGHKDRRFLIAYWACLLTGRAAVPNEPDLPPRRLAGVASVTGSTLLIDAQPDGHDAPIGLTDLVLPVPLLTTAPGITHPPIRAADQDTAYILFSTGTTGEPKGIEVTYANLADFVGWMDQMGSDIGNPGCISANVRYCFDVSLFEMWLSWLNLKPMSGLDHGDIWNIGTYLAQFSADDLSIWVSTPTLAAHYVRHQGFCSDTLPALKAMIFCGEVLPKALVRTLFARFPGIRIFNTYGPTECTVAVTCVEITQAHLDADRELPIGSARHGTWLSADADTTGQGEIIIHGTSVGKGYLGASEEQNARFIAPHSYRTGDWGMQDAKGDWYFKGRRDREIKLDGHRIDLNTVEAAIRDCRDVRDVIVAPPEEGSRMGGLRAFVLGIATTEALERLANEAADRLPPHIIPRFWYAQEDCVFNASGKLDRKQVQADMLARGVRHIHTAARKTTAEKAMAIKSEQDAA
nr:AMP-binding protein [uncultured Gellertiella sp.]